MTIIHVPIVRFVDNSQPGFVECVLTDAFGYKWSIIDKLPVFSNDPFLDEESEYPQPGILACEIIEEKIDSLKRKVAIIDTEKPWGIESVDGNTRFEVLQEQIEII